MARRGPGSGPAANTREAKRRRRKTKGLHKSENPGLDRISQLPQDILISIISLLTTQEAGRTSVLSSRWRYLWTFITRRLNFDAWYSSSDFPPVVGVRRRIDSGTYARWVNEALKSHRGPFIDEFKISFWMESGYSRDIDSWVNFAFEKGVKRFQLDLARTVLKGSPRYDFPWMEKFWSSSDTTPGLQLNGHVARRVGSAGFCNLITLCLKFVDVTGYVIEQFLGNCPFLEQLQVIWSDRLTNLKVAGPSLKLKHLEISDCFELDVLEISAPNLVSLTSKGPFIRMLLENVPVLSEVCTAQGYCESVIYKPRLHFNYLRQLESLKLILPYEVVRGHRRFPREFPELCRLKQLELEIQEGNGKNLISYTALIEACPSLSRYVMRYTLETPVRHREISTSEHDAIGDAGAAAKCEHRCLKVVELVGFIGRRVELELVSHLLEVAVSLDELIIDPRTPSWGTWDDICQDEWDEEDVQAARKRAWRLEKKLPLPPTVNLVVL